VRDVWFLRQVSLLAARPPCAASRADTCGHPTRVLSWVYIQYGIQVLTRQFGLPTPSIYLSILLAILTLVVGHVLTIVSTLPYFHRHVRRFIADYGMPIAVIACSGLAYWGRFHESINIDDSRLPIQAAYTAANGRSWVVPFWELSGKWVGIAFPFGFVLFIVRSSFLGNLGSSFR
jgi:hypothetical protein